MAKRKTRPLTKDEIRQNEGKPTGPSVKPEETESQKLAQELITNREREIEKIRQTDPGISDKSAAEILSSQRQVPSQQAGVTSPVGFPSPARSATRTAEEVNNLNAERQALVAQIAQTPIGPQGLPESSLRNSIQSIIPDIATNVVQKAAIGAAGGAVVGGPPAALAGGIGGAIAGLATAVSNLKEEELQNTKVAVREFKDSKTNLKTIITYAQNGGDPATALAMYNREIQNIARSEIRLKQLGEREWLSKSKDELVQIESFNRTKWIYDQMLADAIRGNPNPSLEFPAETQETGTEEL